MRVNYVISAWSGKRRDGGNGLACLKKQIEQLCLLRHSLSQVTVVVAHNPTEPDDFRSYLQSLGNIGLPVEVFRRENVGLSYGSWSYAYGQCRGSFDYFIFMEDDYYFTEDHFDKTLIEMLGDHGYLCGFVSDNGKDRWPGNSIGIASTKTLEKVYGRFGALPYDQIASDGQYTEESGQIAWGKAFQECGYDLADVTSRYGCLHWYWQHRECRLIPGQPAGNNKFLYVPYQAKLNHNFLLYKDRHKGQEGILFCTGPTLKQYDGREDVRGRVLVGVNSFISEGSDLDYYFCGHMDTRSREYMCQVRAFKGIKFGYTKVDGNPDKRWLSDGSALDLGAIPYELTTGIKFDSDVTGAPFVNHTINFSALQFMIYVGIKRIYLVGCDVTGIISHRDSKIDKDRSIKVMMKVWVEFKKFAEEKEVEVISINPVGLKGMFKERFCNASSK